MLNKRTVSGLLNRASATTRGFTLLEIIVAVGAVALVSVGIAAIFDSVGKTVNVGRRVSRNQALAARIERQIRTDCASMTREGFLVVRNQVTSKVSGPLGNGGFRYAVAVTTPLSVRDIEGGKDASERRIDELMFFAKGSFTSAMEPVTRDYIPRADEAAIYYGHGQRRAVDAALGAGVNIYAEPRVDDDLSMLAQIRNDAAATCLGVNPLEVPAPGITNPNRNASDWVLLRKQTLLIQPSYSALPGNQVPADISTSPLTPRMLRDSDVQIALQPAASSIFQRLQRVYPIETPSRNATNMSSIAIWAGPAGLTPVVGAFGQGAALRPQIASGIVDIATTDLAEIRRIVTTCPLSPSQFSQPFDPLNPPPYPGSGKQEILGTGLANPGVFPDPSDDRNLPWESRSGTVLPANDANFPTNNWTTTGIPQYWDSPIFELNGVGFNAASMAVFRSQAWMDNALPNRSDGFTENYDITSSDRDPRQPGSRVRCETDWTSRDDVIRVTPTSGAGNIDPLGVYWKRRAQLGLSAQNFLEHCSEFIVEWSFGMIDPRTGSIIWYGTPFQDQSGNSPDSSREISVYRGDAAPQDLANLPANFDATRLPYNPWAGDSSLPAALVQLTANPADRNDPNVSLAYRVSKHLIYGNHAPFERTTFVSPEFSDGCFTAHFGYFDPTFNANGHVNRADNGLSATDPANTHSKTYAELGINTLPWAWPKMLRFTVRVADEADPSIEETFQFVVDLPATPHP